MPLRGFDEECRRFITDQYEQKGLNLHPETSPQKIVKNDDGTLTLFATTKDGRDVTLEGLDHVRSFLSS